MLSIELTDVLQPATTDTAPAATGSPQATATPADVVAEAPGDGNADESAATSYDETDSAMGDMADGDSTRSVASTILRHRYEFGRRYHKYREGEVSCFSLGIELTMVDVSLSTGKASAQRKD